MTQSLGKREKKDQNSHENFSSRDFIVYVSSQKIYYSHTFEGTHIINRHLQVGSSKFGVSNGIFNTLRHTKKKKLSKFSRIHNFCCRLFIHTKIKLR